MLRIFHPCRPHVAHVGVCKNPAPFRLVFQSSMIPHKQFLALIRKKTITLVMSMICVQTSFLSLSFPFSCLFLYSPFSFSFPFSCPFSCSFSFPFSFPFPFLFLSFSFPFPFAFFFLSLSFSSPFPILSFPFLYYSFSFSLSSLMWILWSRCEASAWKTIRGKKR